jgi:hypothetical protein
MAVSKKPGLSYAEGLPYWQTSKSGVESWIEKIKKEITRYPSLKGKVVTEAVMTIDDVSSIVLEFELQGDLFRIQWPVMKSKSGNQRAEKVQAATMIFYDVKARVITALVLGARAAFLSFLLLPDGTVAGTRTSSQLQAQLPTVFLLPEGSK